MRRTRSSPFPFWFWFVFAGVHLWYLTVPAAAALLLAGWYGGYWLGEFRWVAFGVAAFLALPFPTAALMYVLQTINAATFWRTLDRDETVVGAQLPAGSRIHFADRAHTDLISVDLPRATEILGVRLVGRLIRCEKWDDVGPVWGGTLAEDQRLNDIPCRAGYFAFDKFGTVFDTRGTVHRFGLASPHEFFGLEFPPGTTVGRGNANRPWHFLLPADMGVHIPALATTAPPGVTLTIANDGCLEKIDSGHGQTIIVCGLPLNSKQFRLQGDQVVSQLAEPFFIDGAMQPAGTEIRVDLPTARATSRSN